MCIRDRITAANVTAASAPTQMEPPAAGCLALGAARSARGHCRIDLAFAGHRPFLRVLNVSVANARSVRRALYSRVAVVHIQDAHDEAGPSRSRLRTNEVGD